jgi:hypothetical protein
MYEICIKNAEGQWVTLYENLATPDDVQKALDALPAGTKAEDVWVGTTTAYAVIPKPADPTFYVGD